MRKHFGDVFFSGYTYALLEGRRPIDFVLKKDRAADIIVVTVYNKVQYELDL